MRAYQITRRGDPLGFEELIQVIGEELLMYSDPVEVETWHAMDVTGNPQLVSLESRNVFFEVPIPRSMEETQATCNPQLPWAERHFQERISGEPLNPPPSAAEWHTPGVVDKHLKQFDAVGHKVYSHTYPERFWPKEAGGSLPKPHYGIRFKYGDLQDVVALLAKQPLTRQAFLPVWFPEDTGAVHGERVPCTLGYHFMIRENKLHCTYMIRSVDFVRHFRDDVYLAMRLTQWIRGQLVERDYLDDPQPTGLKVGNLTMHIMSLHWFEGDRKRMEENYGPLIP